MTDLATEPAATDDQGSAPGDEHAEHEHHDDALDAELLVEEISIDGMCGVY